MGYILDPDLLNKASFRGSLGMSKSEIRQKHPPGTSQKHIDAMHRYMKEGNSFQEAHNRAEASGFPAKPLGKTGATFHLDYPFTTLAMAAITLAGIYDVQFNNEKLFGPIGGSAFVAGFSAASLVYYSGRITQKIMIP
tara:strand:- start:7518 stop:7931 length:414 start_codon:yes stop_codon:yes gene_type:complete